MWLIECRNTRRMRSQNSGDFPPSLTGHSVPLIFKQAEK